LKKGIQRAMLCRCGNAKILALGLCSTCYTLKRQDEEYFGGLREQVLDVTATDVVAVERRDEQSVRSRFSCESGGKLHAPRVDFQPGRRWRAGSAEISQSTVRDLACRSQVKLSDTRRTIDPSTKGEKQGGILLGVARTVPGFVPDRFFAAIGLRLSRRMFRLWKASQRAPQHLVQNSDMFSPRPCIRERHPVLPAQLGRRRAK
jgi:hypothetical protein